MAATRIHLENASQFFIPTPMVKALHERITQWTWCGLTGGIVIGDARNGKTTAIRALTDNIDTRDGQKIHVFKISFGRRDLKTVRYVFEKVAISLGFKVKPKFSAGTLLEMICDCLAEASLANTPRQVILMIDEVQVLLLDQLAAFAEIYNDLFDMHVNVVTFFIANKDQFTPLANQLLEKENTYLRERFFSHVYEFHGLRNTQEVSDSLQAYDNCILDAADQITATQYYCPALYNAGWRLKDIAPIYWEQYSESYKIPLAHSSWSMSQFIRATNILLMDYLPNCDSKDNADYIEGSIIKSLEAAGIIPTLVQVAN